METTQRIVFVAVVLARLVVPLFIPRYPLPAIVLSLVIDGVDQTIFQAFHVTHVLRIYQNYDKALDIYYQVIAYTATMRNWRHPLAFRVGQFLWYYRLVGVLWFELSDWGPVLLIFPNTFEYYFIAYEAVRVLWRPERMSPRLVIGGAAFIWVFIKLPQEWWIHVADLDATDEMGRHPVIATVLFVVLAAVVVAFVAAVRRYAPPPDWRPRVLVRAPEADARPESRREWLETTGEKAVLLSMITVVFANIVPNRADALQLAFVTVVVVVLNGGMTELLASAGELPVTLWKRFSVIVAVNAMIFELIIWLGRRRHVNAVEAFFELFLVSLVITLYDEYRAIRHGKHTRPPGSTSTARVAGAT
jgi:hypothetical protein